MVELDELGLLAMSELFQCFADPTRLKVIEVLLGGARCVGDLTELLGMSQPAVSHHLRLLRQLRLVKTSRLGKKVVYSLADEHIRQLFDTCREHVAERGR